MIIIMIIIYLFINLVFCAQSTPSIHAGSDPAEVFLVGPAIMAVTASAQPKSGRIAYAGSDFPHPFQFQFSKEGMDHTV